MRVISLRTDQHLDEGQSYDAEFKDGFGESPEVTVFFTNPFDDAPIVRKCTRVLDESVITAWNPKPNHGPYDFDA